MNEIRTSGPLLFTEPNNPTRVGEIINTLNEIYDIPMPRLGMSVYVKDEGVNYTITKLEPKLIEGVLVPDAKVAECELQTGKSIAWNSSSNVNDYVVAGVYNIAGERLNINDGLPIANSNPGHTISARLVVLDSSIKGTGDSQDKCITQVLTLSNRTGEDGNMYIRTASGASLDSLTWKPWATQQTNVNVGQVTSLDSFIDNGIYSGVFVESGVPSTFVMIVINDYFVGVSPRRVSQFLCKLNKADGTVSFIYRVGVGNSVLEWGSWVDSTKELQRLIDKNVTDITNEETRAKAEETAIRKLITDLIGESPETLDSIHEISSWILNDQTGAAAMIRQINNLNNVTESTLDALGEEINRATKEENIIRSKALHYNSLNAIPTAEKVNIGGKSVDGSNTLSMAIPTATTETAGVITANDKKKLNNLAVEGADVDLNTYHLDGVYVLSNKKLTNVPILNDSVVSVRLTVLTAYDGTSPVITQVLTLNNLGGGEGNIYIRSKQNSTWKPWGKLQINVEVGQITPDDMSSLIDNGIYSGVCVDGTTVETFVLIVINNYLAASQAGFGSYISQLKYAIDLNRGNTVKTRTRDAYGIWSEWSEIGGSTYELPEATIDILGGVKLGIVKNDEYAPLVNINPNSGGGVGIALDSSVLMNSESGITLPYNLSLTTGVNGLSVRLGTGAENVYSSSSIIPCALGSGESSDGSKWNMPSVGIPYNTEQFCLKYNGLNLVDGIGSGTIKVTWDANSNMNNYTTPGIYDIYGERTNVNDNLPITQAYNGASIAARLTVVASTLQPNNTEKCITQFLQLSNRMGGEGNTYIRTYNENNNGLNGWSEWKKQQGMVESYINTNTIGITTTGGQTTGLNGMTENGMYSGIYTDDYTLQSPTFVETFVLVVINDYAVSSQAGTPRRISQLKYATDTLTGQCTVKKRVGTGIDSISWGDWEDVDTRELVEKKDVISVVDDSENPVQSKAIAAAIQEGEKRALRRLFIAAGAEYNDTGADITKTAPWGETVTHKAGHYYLNGLGDITEEDMLAIFLAKPIASPNSANLWSYSQFRTNLSQFLPEESHNLSKLLTTNVKIQVVNNGREIVCSNITSMFGNCIRLHSVCPILDIGQITSIANTRYAFNNTPKLVRTKVKNLKYDFSFGSSPLLDKASVLYLIQNAAPTSAITVTLHADAYARLAEDADVVAALEAQPLISLVSA